MESRQPDNTRLPEAGISTTASQPRQAAPRLPNEHDASPDSQASPKRSDMQQAAADLAAGQVDTDLRSQPQKNPENNAPAVPAPASTQTLPDGSKR